MLLEDSVAGVEEKIGNIESCIQDMYHYQLDQAFIEDKLIDLKERSRWISLSIDDINKKPNETWEDYETELDKRLKESLGIKEEVVIQRAHKVKTDKSKKSNTWGGLSICTQQSLL